MRRSKGRKPRLITVGGETMRALRRYALLREGLDNSDVSAQAPFFQTIHGTGFTYYGLRSWLHRLERAAGVPHLHLHLLRHTSALETLDARRLADGPAQTGPRRHSHDPGVLEYDSGADRGAAARLQPGRSPWLRNRQPLGEIGKTTARTGSAR